MRRNLKTSLSNSVEKNKYHITAFAIPVLVMVIAYALREVRPFGDMSILSIDLWGQYFPMIANYISKFGKGDMLYSWSGAFGYNALAQNAYYTASPLNLLLLFFPRSLWISVIDYLPVLRMGIASLTFSLLLKYKFKESSLLTVAFSSAYGLSMYFLAFNSQLMWQDAVMLFPLIVIGINKLLNERKILLYGITLSVILISNFYIGYCVCLFTALYFVVEVIVDLRKDNLKRQFGSCVIFALTSISAGATAGVLLIPTYKAINLAISSTYGFNQEIKLYRSFFEFIDSMLPGINPELEFGAPNIYCGLIVAILVISYLFNDGIKLKKRVCYMFFAAFMLLSLNLNLLDFVWHGFHFPNQLPGRQSFLFIFLVLYMAYESARNISKIRSLQISAVGLACIIALLVKISDSKAPELRYIAIGLVVVYTAVLLLGTLKDGKKLRQYLASAIALIFIVETCASSIYVFAEYGKTSDQRSYMQNDENITELVNKYESDENDFYRMELSYRFTFNPGMLYNYNGISYYSSTMTGDAYNVMEKLGFDVYARNVSRLYVPSPITNSMFSVKYIIDNAGGGVNLTAYDRIIDDENPIDVYENKACLPLAYMTSSDILNWQTTENTGNFIDVQNELMINSGATKADILDQQDFIITSDENTIAKMSGKNTVQYTIPPNESASVGYSCTAEKAGTAYIYSRQPKNGSLSVFVDGAQVWSTGSAGVYTRCIPVQVKEGSLIEIVVKSENQTDSQITHRHDLYIAVCDEDEFLSAINQLAAGGLEISEFKNTKITGQITAGTAGIMFTSIPDDGGWSVYCDGVKLETLTIGGLFLGAEIPEGTHDITLKYSVPGLRTGIIVSFCGIILMATVWFATKSKKY